MLTISRILPVLLASLLLLAPAGAQDTSNFPSPESLFEAHIKAIGGRDALAKHHDRTLYGIYRVPDSQETQALTIYAEGPNHMRAELVQPAVGTIVRATDGTDAWGTNTTGTPFELRGRDRDELLDSARFDGEAGYKDAYTSVNTTGQGNIDGKPAWRVEFETKSGLKGAVFFDAASGLVCARQIYGATQSTPPTLVVVGDYKEFEGVKLPTRQRQLVGDQFKPMVDIEFRWVEVNTGDMPQFAAPENTTRVTEGSN